MGALFDRCNKPEILEKMYQLIDSMGSKEFPEIAPIWFPEIGDDWVEIWRMLCLAHESMVGGT